MTPAAEFQVDADVAVARGSEEPALIVDVEGFEGPLDLLLMLSRQQKVDLAKISILALADQYLAFIEAARKVRLELAADYLVMAAWLAYLKSRLLLPESHDGTGPSAEEMAAALALRLKRLEAIRSAAEQLVARPQLERDVFRRGAPEPIVDVKRPEWTATLYDLLSAYAAHAHADPARWTFVTGPLDDVERAVVLGFKVSAAKVAAGADDYQVVHGDWFVLVDRAGDIRGYYSTGEERDFDGLTADVARLAAERP